MAVGRRTPPGSEDSNGRLPRRIVGKLAPIPDMKIIKPYPLIFALLFFLSPGAFLFSAEEVSLSESYKKACGILKQNLSVWESVWGSYQITNRLLLPAVFPELMRYHPETDRIELGLLKLFYTAGGAKKADYSVGYFQMKPSFAETLENLVLMRTELKAFRPAFEPFWAEKNLRRQRELRIERLSDSRWQAVYLACFIEAVKLRFPDLNRWPEEQKVFFLASAYNGGFLRPQKRILNEAFRKTYPYGVGHAESRFVYAEIALKFFHQGCP